MRTQTLAQKPLVRRAGRPRHRDPVREAKKAEETANRAIRDAMSERYPHLDYATGMERFNCGEVRSCSSEGSTVLHIRAQSMGEGVEWLKWFEVTARYDHKTGKVTLSRPARCESDSFSR